MKIGAAQMGATTGDIEGNLQTHLAFIESAARHAVDCLVFPELSLTGYEPELAKAMALTPRDPRLMPLARAASHYQMQLVVGLPLALSGLPAIAALIFHPSGRVSSYSKMHLHAGEDRSFSSGRNHGQIVIGNHAVGLAICADANHPEHAKANANLGASVYAVGAMITGGGYAGDTANLADRAWKHHLLVLLANHHQPTGGWQPIGKSAAWGPSGQLAQAPETGDALVIAEWRPTE